MFKVAFEAGASKARGASLRSRYGNAGSATAVAASAQACRALAVQWKAQGGSPEGTLAWVRWHYYAALVPMARTPGIPHHCDSRTIWSTKFLVSFFQQCRCITCYRTVPPYSTHLEPSTEPKLCCCLTANGNELFWSTPTWVRCRGHATQSSYVDQCVQVLRALVPDVRQPQ